MRVKRYMGKTNQEVLEKIKESLGKDAVILSTRKIRKKGLRGFFEKPLIEIVAAIDDNNINFSKQMHSDKLEDKEKAVFEEIEKQIKSMNNTVDKLLTRMETQSDNPRQPFSQEYMNYYNELLNNEVHEEVARSIIEDAKRQCKDLANLDTYIENIILNCLGQPKPIVLDKKAPEKIMFIGPTGVGKTTTLAKLAAIFSIKYNKNVALITTDTYRIAAAEQLRIYGEILDLSLDIAYSPNEVFGIIERYIDKDIILIDTAGKSIKDREHEEEIKQLINACIPDQIYLCISANTSYNGCKNIITNYNFIPDYSIIFTKMDEISNYGTIINSCYLSGKSISYITTGQSVPDDIDVANTTYITEQVMGRQIL